jgi:hypothetical protein
MLVSAQQWAKARRRAGALEVGCGAYGVPDGYGRFASKSTGTWKKSAPVASEVAVKASNGSEVGHRPFAPVSVV